MRPLADTESDDQAMREARRSRLLLMVALVCVLLSEIVTFLALLAWWLMLLGHASAVAWMGGVLATALVLSLGWATFRTLRRRRFRYDLRTLFTLVTLAALASGCLAYYLPKYRQDRCRNRTKTLAKKHHASIEERVYYGKAYVAYNICFGDLTDHELAEMAGHPDLTGLELRGTHVTDRGMAALAQFPGLARLDISYTDVTAAGIQQLRSVPTLTALTLDAKQLRELVGVPRDSLPQVQHLWLNDPRIDDAAISSLECWSNLDSVVVVQVAISDNGLERIGSLSTLTHLSILECSGVTDVGLHHLRNLKRLQFLYVGGTNATPAAGAKLQESLPNCRIIVSQGPMVPYAGGPLAGSDQNGDEE